MPYSSTNNLPPNVKNSLTAHEQSAFMKAFNSAYEDGKDEKSCFKIAWAAAKKAKAK